MEMPDKHNEPREQSAEAPARLAAALKRIPEPRIFIPTTVDESILRAAERKLTPKRHHELQWRGFLRWFAAAAALVLLLGLIAQFLRKHNPAQTAGSGFAREDLNHDGQVDILDAFALARQLRTGAPANPQMDLNGDGVVDERDVSYLSSQAVRVDKGGRS
jgi:hypothetical protein